MSDSHNTLQAIRLPYMRVRTSGFHASNKNASNKNGALKLRQNLRRDGPSGRDAYHAALKNGVEGYDQARRMIAWLFDIVNFESSVPQPFTLKEKNKLYQWELSDPYPPHLKTVPPDQFLTSEQIFSKERLDQTLLIISGGSGIGISELAPGPHIDTMAKLDEWNRERHTDEGFFDEDMYSAPNIGLLSEWYTDAVFAQQFFTGTNPTIITLATKLWIDLFQGAAKTQHNDKVSSLLSSAPSNSFYVLDYSYFRSVMGVKPDEIFSNASEGVSRYGCAPVALFYLPPTGKLHPLAIVLDYKGSMDASVTIFNKHVDPKDTPIDQYHDWAWRYAKTCVQVADWTRHEMIIHLTNTHLVEEAIIVAAHRRLDPTHIVFRLLEPHWVVTLSLNYQARTVLVPAVIAPIAGFSASNIFPFLKQAFSSFEWKSLYIPHDLEKRGFPINQLDEPKFHNYAYARNMVAMWKTLRNFVESVLRNPKYYTDDASVARDAQLQGFCAEMRSKEGAGMEHFPDSIKTLDDLIDVVTMCIHIASPQHTAVNYLQQFYQTFVPNKPSALFSPLPKTLQELQAYNEQSLLAALPLKSDRDWLLAAQIPYLLSMAVEDDGNIIAYADTASQDKDSVIAKAGKRLSADLDKLATLFNKHSEQLDDQNIPYHVLAPESTATAIVI